jgi:hypothetical protein
MEESLEDIARRVRESEWHTKPILRAHRASREAWWRELAGDAVAKMMYVPEYAYEYLGDPDAKIRIVAFDILVHHWKPDPYMMLAAGALAHAFHDPEPEVRAVALLALGACHVGTKYRRIPHKLAKAVSDTSCDNRLRRAAYWALLQVCDVPMKEWPDPT